MGKLIGESSTEIDAPIDTVWSHVQDVLAAPEWQGGMKKMTAVESDGEGRATLVEVTVDGKVKDLVSTQSFAYAGPTKLSWEQTKGEMKSVNGSWELESIDPTRTRATYAIEVDLGRKLGLLIRGPVEMALRALLVNPRAGELKKRVEN